ncbi:MAG: glycoside hydrolase family 2 TIM barrel-domain containing protein [Cytophagales bacterium]|nr:glycoside hydrolase family 2 TIM barrel-domain containing protein [Cytophagales bacterium]
MYKNTLLLIALFIIQSIFCVAQNIDTLSNWQYQVDYYQTGETQKWYSTQYDKQNWASKNVPAAWDTYDEALWGYEGTSWYYTTFTPQNIAPDNIVILKFNRVSIYSKVWLNGQYLGENKNGYLPFEYDITSNIIPNKTNQIVMQVNNEPKPDDLPGSKTIEWIQYGGILQSVALITYPKAYIQDIYIATDKENKGFINASYTIVNKSNTASKATLNLSVAGSDLYIQKKISVPTGMYFYNLTFPVKNPKIWSPETPTLYELKSTLTTENAIHIKSQKFGIRTIATQGTDILLNGKPIKIKGVDRYEDIGKYGPNPPLNVLMQDIKLLKDAGVNFIRTHYPYAPATLDLLDEAGFMVMEEIPINWWGTTTWGPNIVQDTNILKVAIPFFDMMYTRDRNHPCIVIWSMSNECNTSNDTSIYVMQKLLLNTKKKDPTRLASYAYAGETLKNSKAYQYADIVCFNRYPGLWDKPICHHSAQLYETVEKPMQAYINHQMSHYPQKPSLVTEYGARGIYGISGETNFSEDLQALMIQSVWKTIEATPRLSGGILWSWADYYHRKNFIDYAVFGPYGVVTTDRKKKKSYETLKKLYTASGNSK